MKKKKNSILKVNRIPIWIIDDNKSYCMVLSESLNLDKKVLCERYFHSIRTALKEIRTCQNPPPIILLDIKMPQMSGINGIVPLREASQGTKIIMLTSYDDEAEIQTALNLGASGYLLKTSTPEDIIRAIERVMEGGSPIDPMVTKKIMGMLLNASKESRYLHQLTDREVEVIHLIAKGFSTKKIAKKLSLSRFTVDTHLKNIYNKLRIHNRHSLVAKAYTDGLIR